MYATVRRYRVDPDLTGDVISRILDDLSPLIRGVQGCLAYNVCDAGDGRIFTISVFEDQAGAETSHEIVAGWLKENVASFLDSGADLTRLRVEESLQGPFYGDPPRCIYDRNPRNAVNRELPSSDEAPKSSDGTHSRLLSVEELCELLGVGKSWIYQRLRSGEVPSIKLGRSFRVRTEDLDEYLRGKDYRSTGR